MTSYLIQRLLPPMPHGGLNDCVLGFNEESLAALNNGFMSFDYMGNSRFEGAALPAAFERMSQLRRPYCFEAVEIDVLPPEHEAKLHNLPEKKTVTVYIIAPTDIKKEMIEFIGQEGLGYDLGLVEPSFFREAAFSEEVEKATDIPLTFVKGWFDLSNGAFFFIDKEMFEKTKTRFVSAPAPKTTPETTPASALAPHA